MTTTLVICRGLPGSGKTTYARGWVAEDPAGRTRINRDDVRAMVHTTYAGHATEEATTRVCHAGIRAELAAGKHVIVDDTNLNARNVKRLLTIARQAGAYTAFMDFPVDLDVAIARDEARTKQVGAKVIRGMYDRYLRQHDGQLPPKPFLPVEEQTSAAPYTPVPGTPKAFLLDLDGTVAHNYGHRDWYDYSRVRDDAPIQPIIDLAWHLIAAGYTPIVMSGRDDSCREDTMSWLFDNAELAEVDYAGPFMRTTGDTRKDSIVKLELFDREIRDHFDVRYVLDDRNQVVAAWRSIGLTVLQVADGDF